MSAKQSRFIVSLCNIVFGEPEEKLLLFFSFSHNEGDESSSSLVPNFDMALPAVSFSFYSGSCASLHGILAVETEAGQLMMCNPSTEQVVKLTSDCIFVGYDPIDDQYKVLSWDNNIWEDPNAHLKHKVLTLGDGQGWRHIKDTTLPYRAISPNVCINGFLYYGTNRAGEIIMAPSLLSVNLQPFYIFYYNVETKNIRRVRLLGIGDSEEFRRSYGFEEHAKAFVNIAHQHVESIAFFKDPFI
ncbi:F-box associated interaction domain [Arabidopsis suecica]|uniref:F-box associated interaction domain n=1 Tax=Arabidopsis suecica TaxID=45249 RepID=A0A8T2CWF4_ARASU|nr:F-box associated interaction domain [Arabidopsis suecica]